MANKLADLSDPAYVMSAPSRDPANVLGYYQWANQPVANPESPYRNTMEHPIRRAGFNPYYDVFVPPGYDPLNMGAKSRMWGATLPAGMNWRRANELMNKGLDKKAGKALYKYLNEGEIDEDRRSDLKYSDQTVYFNQAVQSQDRPRTVAHESTHRGLSKLAAEKWGAGYLDLKTNMLITRVMDYQYGDKKARESAKEWIKGLSLDGTIEGGIKQVMPLIEELTEPLKPALWNREMRKLEKAR